MFNKSYRFDFEGAKILVGCGTVSNSQDLNANEKVVNFNFCIWPDEHTVKTLYSINNDVYFSSIPESMMPLWWIDSAAIMLMNKMKQIDWEPYILAGNLYVKSFSNDVKEFIEDEFKIIIENEYITSSLEEIGVDIIVDQTMRCHSI